MAALCKRAHTLATERLAREKQAHAAREAERRLQDEARLRQLPAEAPRHWAAIEAQVERGGGAA